MVAAKEIIDFETWERKEYYDFFGKMADPFFAMAAKVDFTSCYEQAKADKSSFFLYYLHKILKALNSVPELRCRIEDGRIVRYEYVGVSSTIGRPDGSFGYSYIEYYPDRATFVAAAAKEVERVRNGHGLMIGSQEQRLDTCYFTSIPWIDFTAIRHPGGNKPGDSVPKLAVGKLVEENGRKLMTVEIEANHGLADGGHFGLFFKALESDD